MKYFIVFIFFVFFAQSCQTQTRENGNKEVNDFSGINAENLEDVILKEGKIHRVKTFPSKYIQPRSVDIWLPQDYSEKNKYAVLYMHDGHMLFDANSTWNKQEWKVDEHASQLMKDNETRDFIVVGIHSISSIRWLDLFPEKAFDLLDSQVKDSITAVAEKNNFSLNFSGDDYLKFLVEELKPYIDNTYSVHTNKENTFVAGSSMGGLMSMYAIFEYPELFEGAACISTHWEGAQPMDNNPYTDAIFNYMRSNVPKSATHKIYFDYGTETLDQFYPKHAQKVDSVFLSTGYTDLNFKNLEFEGADHSENSWNKRLHIPLTFLLKE